VNFVPGQPRFCRFDPHVSCGRRILLRTVRPVCYFRQIFEQCAWHLVAISYGTCTRDSAFSVRGDWTLAGPRFGESLVAVSGAVDRARSSAQPNPLVRRLPHSGVCCVEVDVRVSLACAIGLPRLPTPSSHGEKCGGMAHCCAGHTSRIRRGISWAFQSPGIDEFCLRGCRCSGDAEIRLGSPT